MILQSRHPHLHSDGVLSTDGSTSVEIRLTTRSVSHCSWSPATHLPHCRWSTDAIVPAPAQTAQPLAV